MKIALQGLYMGAVIVHSPKVGFRSLKQIFYGAELPPLGFNIKKLKLLGFFRFP
jgi:hypothetical protein